MRYLTLHLEAIVHIWALVLSFINLNVKSENEEYKGQKCVKHCYEVHKVTNNLTTFCQKTFERHFMYNCWSETESNNNGIGGSHISQNLGGGQFFGRSCIPYTTSP